jgi:hypothetical protein
VTDAWHSLSIEGCPVTPELIRRVRIATWNSDAYEQDREQRIAMAARGYWQVFHLVQKTIDGNGRMERFLMNVMMTWLPVDGHPALRTQHLHGCSRKSQCTRRYRAFRRISNEAPPQTDEMYFRRVRNPPII